MIAAIATCGERRILGLAVVGQSPNPSLTSEVVSVIPSWIEIREAGALDGLSREEIERNHQPASRERTFFTSLSDGESILVDKKFVHEQLQKAVRILEKQASVIGILCSGAFDDLKCRSLLVVPNSLLQGYVRAVRIPGKWGLVMPTEVSLAATLNEFERCKIPAIGKCISPSDTLKEFQLLIADMTSDDISAVLLNCFGYTETMCQTAKLMLRRPVIRIGTLLAQALVDLLT